MFLSSSTDVSVNSNPVAAQITINGVTHGITPMQVTLSSRDDHTIVISKEGYQTVSCVINRKVSGTIVVLDVLTGLVPVIIDASTGGWYKLESDVCSVTLPEAQ